MRTLSVASNHRNGEKGFTLIELLVVVTIIGILAAIVSVSVGGFTGKASVQAHKSTVNGVQAAVDAYIADHYDGSGAVKAPTLVATFVLTAGSATLFYNTNGVVETSAGANVAYRQVDFDLLTQSAVTVIGNTSRTQGPYLRLGGNAAIACVFKNEAGTDHVTNATVDKMYQIILCTDTEQKAQ